MKMIRTFNSIGHGGFSTEEFDDFTMVYDCGGRNLDVINKEIKFSLKEGETIDALFISHFHRDHINGLQYLLKNYHVKRVFLPYLHDNLKIQLFIENVLYGGNDSFTKGIISDYYSTIRNYSELSSETLVIPVMPLGESPLSSSQERLNIDSLPNKIKSGMSITIESSGTTNEWVLIPFNFEFSAYADKIVSELGLIGINFDNIQDYLRTNRTKVIEVYKAVLNGENHFNSCSLTLYSGTQTNIHDYYLGITPLILYTFPYWHDSVGCLYLGDYNAKDNQAWNELQMAYGRYADNIGTIQIPHHGSFHNYNDNLNNKRGLISVIHANRHGRHPHASTVKAIFSNYGIPIVVTEEPSSRLIQQIVKH
jgi:hypothetical protein